MISCGIFRANYYLNCKFNIINVYFNDTLFVLYSYKIYSNKTDVKYNVWITDLLLVQYLNEVQNTSIFWEEGSTNYSKKVLIMFNLQKYLFEEFEGIRMIQNSK